MSNFEPLTLILILGTACLIIISIVFWSLRLGITPTPSSHKVRATLRDTLPLKVDGNIYELGSGFGSLISMLAKKYPDQTLYAIERSPIPYWISRLRYGHLKNVTIIQQDFFNLDWEGAGLILCYLYPGAMEKLSREFPTRLKKGCYIISHTFRLPGWEPELENKATDLYRSPVYRYRVNHSVYTPVSGRIGLSSANDKQSDTQGHN